MIDTSIVRVYLLARNKRQAMGRSRGKIQAVVDSSGLPVRLALTAGEAHDNRLAAKLLSRLKPGAMLLADRGYDVDWIRELVSKHGAWANISPRWNRKDALCFSAAHPRLCRARGGRDRCWRAADRLAAHRGEEVRLARIPNSQIPYAADLHDHTRKLIASNREFMMDGMQGFVETIHLFKTRPDIVVPSLQRYLHIGGPKAARNWQVCPRKRNCYPRDSSALSD